MKLLKIIIISLGAIAASSFYMSCAKNNPAKVADTDDDFSNATLVQVFDATVSSARTFVYVDGSIVSGGSPLAFGSVFPATAYAFKVNAGLRSFLIKDTLRTTTQAPLAFAENFDVGKNYTIFMYDTTPSAKQVTIQNDIVFPSDTAARVKFANFIYNSTDVPAVDIFSKRINANLFTNVSKTMVTGFIPYASNVNDTLLVRETGTTNLLATFNAFNATPRRSYTLVYRGSYKGTRVLSSFTND